jgi:hypothetical protein
VSQRYENREKKDIECIYFFPVEEEAAVVEFIATLDGREIKSQVRERLYVLSRNLLSRVADPHFIRIRIQHFRLNTNPDPGL